MNTRARKAGLALLLAGLIPLPSRGVIVADFEDLSLAPGGYWNGTSVIGAKTFQSQGVTFHNTSFDWGGGFTSWEGFGYSNANDTTTAGYTNQYAVWTPGTGHGGAGNYGIAYRGGARPRLTLADPAVVREIWVNNTTYAALSMRNGDAFAKKFGGTDGTDEDWFRLTVFGLDSDDNELGSVEFYLADYRFADSALDYIVGAWTRIDTSALGAVKHLEFDLASSDVGSFGMNTPAYFALDDIEVIPEPWSALMVFVGALTARMVRHRRA